MQYRSTRVTGHSTELKSEGTVTIKARRAQLVTPWIRSSLMRIEDRLRAIERSNSFVIQTLDVSAEQRQVTG